MIGLSEFNIFLVKIYLEHWFTSTLAAQAALNDVKLIEQLKQYRQINSSLAEAALKIMSRHMWYLSDITLGLSFFDPRHSEESLAKMAASLDRTGDQQNLFRKVLNNDDDELDVTNMVSQNTCKFFEIVGVDYDFIRSPPSCWHENDDYIKIKEIANNLTVVNDPAERAIGLLKTVNNTLTMDSTQQNNLIQVIEKFNQNHPNGNKGTILKNLEQ